MVVWLCGCVVLWLYGCVVVWSCSCVIVWLCDYIVVWLCDCMGMYFSECMYIFWAICRHRLPAGGCAAHGWHTCHASHGYCGSICVYEYSVYTNVNVNISISGITLNQWSVQQASRNIRASSTYVQEKASLFF